MLPRLAASPFSSLTPRLVALACLTLSPMAQAMDLNLDHEFYFVGSLARSSMDDGQLQGGNDALIRARANPTNFYSTQNTNESAYKLTLGFEFKPSFALELAYVDLGTTRYAASYRAHASSSGSLPVTGNVSVGGTVNAWMDATSQREVKYSGVTLAAVGKRALNDKLTVFGKLGAIFAEARATDRSYGEGIYIGAYGFGRGGNKTERSVRPLYGVGLDYMFKPSLGLRLEAEGYSKLGDRDTVGSTDINLMSLGLVGRF